MSGADVLERGLLIGGKSVPASSGKLTDDVSPWDGEIYARVAAGTPADITRAADAAEAAFPSWSWHGRYRVVHRAALGHDPAQRSPHLSLLGTMVTVVFAGLSCWLLIAARDGSGDLGLVERLTAAVQSLFPLVVALGLRQTARDVRVRV
jgi:hypothetical protein